MRRLVLSAVTALTLTVGPLARVAVADEPAPARAPTTAPVARPAPAKPSAAAPAEDAEAAPVAVNLPTTPATGSPTGLPVVRPSTPLTHAAEEPVSSGGWKLALIALVGAGGYWFWQKKKRDNGGVIKADEAVKVVGRTKLSPQSELVVVRSEGQKFLLGVSAQSIQMLAALDSDDEDERGRGRDEADEPARQLDANGASKQLLAALRSAAGVTGAREPEARSPALARRPVEEPVAARRNVDDGGVERAVTKVTEEARPPVSRRASTSTGTRRAPSKRAAEAPSPVANDEEVEGQAQALASLRGRR